MHGLQPFVMSQNNTIASSTKNVTMTSSLRVTEFNASDTEMWFAVVEAYFTKAHITDCQERYLDVVSSLPPRYANEVRDVIMRPIVRDVKAAID